LHVFAGLASRFLDFRFEIPFSLKDSNGRKQKNSIVDLVGSQSKTNNKTEFLKRFKSIQPNTGKIMETTGKTEAIVEIDQHIYLMRVFNAINTSIKTIKFSYQGIRFWREGDEFLMEYKSKLFQAGEIYDFDEFESILLARKKR
jgi:hypothetical protein